MQELFQNIIDRAQFFGLPKADVINSQEFLDNREYGLCFDTIVIQMYESGVEIDKHFYELLIQAADKIKVSTSDFEYIRKLIR